MAFIGGFADGETGEADDEGLSVAEYREYQEELNRRFLQSVSSD
jgi:hypothetical protein